MKYVPTVIQAVAGADFTVCVYFDDGSVHLLDARPLLAKGDVLSGAQDKNISFAEICSLLEWLGFECHVRGDHFIYTMDGIDEIINIQPKGGKAKPYQVKQIREIIVDYHLGGDFGA